MITNLIEVFRTFFNLGGLFPSSRPPVPESPLPPFAATPANPEYIVWCSTCSEHVAFTEPYYAEKFWRDHKAETCHTYLSSYADYTDQLFSVMFEAEGAISA